MFILDGMSGVGGPRKREEIQTPERVRTQDPGKAPAEKQPTVDWLIQRDLEGVEDLANQASKSQRLEQVQNAILSEIEKDRSNPTIMKQLLNELKKLNPENTPLSGHAIDEYTAGQIDARENISVLEGELEILTDGNSKDPATITRHAMILKQMTKWKVKLGFYQDFLDMSNKAKEKQPVPPPLTPKEQTRRAEHIDVLHQELEVITDGGIRDKDTLTKLRQILKELRKLEPERVPLPDKMIEFFRERIDVAKVNTAILEKELEATKDEDSTDPATAVRHTMILKERSRWETKIALYKQFINQSNKAKENQP